MRGYANHLRLPTLPSQANRWLQHYILLFAYFQNCAIRCKEKQRESQIKVQLKKNISIFQTP